MMNELKLPYPRPADDHDKKNMPEASRFAVNHYLAYN